MVHPRDRGSRGLSRRDFLRRSLAAGVALPTASAILAACGGDGGGNGGTDANGEDITPGFGTAEHPATLQLYDDNPAIASDLEPEAGPLVLYNWEQYIWKKVVREFGKKYGVGDQVRDLLQHGAGDPEVPVRGDRRRHLLPDDRLPPQAGRGQDDPAAEPRLHPQPQERLARTPEPVLRPGVAILGPVHDLHDGHRLADRPRAGRARGLGRQLEPVRDLLERRLRRRGGDLRRVPRGALAGHVSRSISIRPT